ncbi:MAG: DUF4296 domain-containing protein [Cyclobacteriaceae bacterium]|jgi:hypothetical protein|nr:hypothetical protein [Cytophagales bacterium]HNP77552.1 DUF4296 domain-containing protein [Cyclobacteriaceae bacterium]
MKLSFLLVILLLLPLSCKKDEKLPPGVMTREEMVKWMIPIYLAEARTQLLNLNRDSAYRIFIPLQDSLKRSSGIQDSVFVKSYQYYLDHSPELEAVYDAVIDSLSLREQKLRQAIGN